MKIQQIFRPVDLITAKEDLDALMAYQLLKRVPNGAMCFSNDCAFNIFQELGAVKSREGRAQLVPYASSN